MRTLEDNPSDHDCEVCGTNAFIKCPKCRGYYCSECIKNPCKNMRNKGMKVLKCMNCGMFIKTSSHVRKLLREFGLKEIQRRMLETKGCCPNPDWRIVKEG